MQLVNVKDSLTRGFIRELDGLRGIAISLVLVHRFWPDRGPLHRWASLAELGWVGVDLFFVISGFLIAGILLDTRGDPHFYRNFYARRMLRIFPLYYLFVAGCLLLFPLTQPGAYFETPFIQSAGSPLWYLFYLGNVPETIGHDPPYVLGPIWSLAIEEQFYIVFPFVVATLDPARLKKVLLGLIVLAPLFRLLALLLVPSNERIQYLATPCRMDCISYGALLALLLRIEPSAVGSRASVARALGVVAALCLVAFPLGVLTRTTPWGRVLGYSLVAIAFTVLLAFVLQRRDEAATAFLRWPPLQYVGKICYGTYLLHRPADVFVDKLAERLDILDPQSIPGGATSVALLVAKFGVAIAFATASWYAFEKPILRLKDRFQPRNHPSATAPIAPPAPPELTGRANVPESG
ncbi:acyltransferase family protein [Pendulispora albinea]|uniref:Acyltransferase n=1 Tax=Pendulispora albinea TaxID=2741071 RepID=A0ABZ2LU70_9BACT